MTLTHWLLVWDQPRVGRDHARYAACGELVRDDETSHGDRPTCDICARAFDEDTARDPADLLAPDDDGFFDLAVTLARTQQQPHSQYFCLKHQYGYGVTEEGELHGCPQCADESL